MAQYTTVSQLSGLYKEAYADGIVGLIPDVAYLVKNINFSEAEKVGNYYHQPVVLTREAGVTYAAAGAGAYTLNSSVAMTMQDAQVQGSQTTLRSSIPYDTVARSTGSGKAFRKATLPIIENNLESHTKRLEVAALYGQKGLGVSASSANIGSTSTKVTFTDASWAIGIWAGEEGSKCVAISSSDASIVSGDGSAEVLTIVSIDPDNKAVTFSAASATITALDSATSAGCTFHFWNGAAITSSATTYSFNEMAGVDKIVTNASTLFNISAATYTLWKGNTYSAASGQLTMAKVFAAVNKAVGKGGLKEKATVLVSTDTWPNMMTDLAALRKFDSSYQSGQAVNGFETIKYVGANGELEVVPHSCVKSGEAFVLPLKRWKRVGAQEISFQTPGRSDEIFLQLANNNGFELRSYADQAVFCQTPAKCVKVTTIVNV